MFVKACNILRNCLDSHYLPDHIKVKHFAPQKAKLETVDLFFCFPIILLHLSCLFVFWVGYSHTALFTLLACYLIRMFAITGFYHRYFSHKSFKTSRFWQFCFALLGCSAVQRGPLWWAAHHRHHHRYSDKEKDIHSPIQQSFMWSHCKWILSKHNFPVNQKMIKDLVKYPELIFLDRFDKIIPAAMFVFLYGLGAFLQSFVPSLGTSPWQLVVWGFVLSTVCLLHATFTINSLSHLWGTRPYNTDDNSRNNFLLAIITLGEGWHNNHHFYPGCVRQGFKWWQIDITYYILWVMKKLRIIWDLKEFRS